MSAKTEGKGHEQSNLEKSVLAQAEEEVDLFGNPTNKSKKNKERIRFDKRTCPRCGKNTSNNFVCDKCQKDLPESRDYVEGGELYWKCVKCKSYGVLQPNDFCLARPEYKNPILTLAGVEIEEELCPVCGANSTDKG